MSPVLIIDWQGATFDVLRAWIAERKLPNVASLIEAGAHGALRAAPPTAQHSPDAWQPLCDAGRKVIFVPAEPPYELLDTSSDDTPDTAAAARRVMRNELWDCVKITFQQPPGSAPGQNLLAVYQELDRQIAELTPLLSKDATLLLLSVPPQPLRSPADARESAQDGGMFLACGASIRPGIEVPGASIHDVARTALRLLDIPAPEGVEGRVLEELFFIDHSVEDERLGEERIIAERLRSLGYIE